MANTWVRWIMYVTTALEFVALLSFFLPGLSQNAYPFGFNISNVVAICLPVMVVMDVVVLLRHRSASDRRLAAATLIIVGFLMVFATVALFKAPFKFTP